MKISDIWERFVYSFFQFLPSVIVCLTFVPNGLAFGYTVCALVASHIGNVGGDTKVIELGAYGPLMLGGCFGLLCAIIMFGIKCLRGRYCFWHTETLLITAGLQLLASCFYYAKGYDRAGSYISYCAHSLSWLVGFSFLHAISSKRSRAVMLSLCCSCYLLGIALALSALGDGDGAHLGFALLYTGVSLLLLLLLSVLKLLSYLGTVDTKHSMDNEFRIANSNGSVFERRDEAIRHIPFFYVTANQQWHLTGLLLFVEAVQTVVFSYALFWFTMNPAMQLSMPAHIDGLFWSVFVGSLLSNIALFFISAKVNYVTCQLCLIALTVVGMLFYAGATHSKLAFWLMLVLFGACYSNLQIASVEVTNLRFTELAIYCSYLSRLVSTACIYNYFVADPSNLFFYSSDTSALAAQGFVFITISALLAMLVGMQVPRTYRMNLLDIQYAVYGIIFKKHQIQQLNVRWLNDGTIPTISRPEQPQLQPPTQQTTNV